MGTAIKHPVPDRVKPSFACVSVSKWAGFNVSTNTVGVIWETVLQVKRLNQQCQSTEGRQKINTINTHTHSHTRTKTQKIRSSTIILWG